MGPTQNNQANGAGQNTQAAAPVNNNAAMNARLATAAVPAASQDNMMAAGVSAKKSGKGMAIGLVLCLLLAAGGIGFGVWAMLDGNSRVDSLNEQISALKTQNSELLDKLSSGAVNGDSGAGDTEISTSGSDTETMDYIYVGEWGLKIKTPEGLAVSGYDYNASYDSYWGGTASMLAIWGTKMGGGQYFPDFANITKNTGGQGMVMRFPSGTELSPESTPLLLFSDGGYDYYYTRATAPYSVAEDEQKWESESNDLIYEMISDKGNYLKI